MTFTMGIVYAASFLTMGRVFTANMTGNIVFLGLHLGGAAEFSASRSLFALAALLTSATAGGKWMSEHASASWIAPAISAESGLLALGALVAAVAGRTKRDLWCNYRYRSCDGLVECRRTQQPSDSRQDDGIDADFNGYRSGFFVCRRQQPSWGAPYGRAIVAMFLGATGRRDGDVR